MTINKYYFSFGSSEFFPYQFGFVTIYASDLKEAIDLYRRKYPDRPGNEGTVNCSFMYHEADVHDPLEAFGGQEWDVLA